MPLSPVFFLLGSLPQSIVFGGTFSRMFTGGGGGAGFGCWGLLKSFVSFFTLVFFTWAGSLSIGCNMVCRLPSVGLVSSLTLVKVKIWRWFIFHSSWFSSQFSPWKQGPQKKLNTPGQSQRKILLNSHLRFFIFETLSQRCFSTKLCKIPYFINKLV